LETEGNFKSLLEAGDDATETRRVSPVLKRTQVLPAGRRVLSFAAGKEELSWDLIKEGGTIRGLRFRCACGRTTELYFEYEHPADR